MIPYVEILKWNDAKTSLESFQLIEPSECWFELSYYENGQFEVYVAANSITLNALKKGNFVKIPHKDFLWIITSIQYEYNAEGGRMIDAKGYEAKWVVSKRIIRDPLQLPSSLVTAMQLLFDKNIGSSAIIQRQIKGLTYDFSALVGKTTEAQATRGNLLEFSLNLLKLHKSGLISTYQNGKINVAARVGVDKSESVIFSQSLDNLINSNYYSSDEEKKTHCQIVSTFSETTGSGTARTTTSQDYVAYYPNENAGESDIDRAEMMLQSNLSTKVTQPDGTEVEIDPSSTTYKKMQQSEGASALSEKITITQFEGQIDLQYCQYSFSVQNEENTFFIGDLVKVQDEYFGYSAKARINKYTFKQDANGYGEEAEYSTEAIEDEEETGFITDEDEVVLATEVGIRLATEESNISTPNRKISELDEIQSDENGYIPIVSNGETKKIKAGNLGGGTGDYTDLTNKPQIEGNELNGNKTFSQLGLSAMEQLEIDAICD